MAKPLSKLLKFAFGQDSLCEHEHLAPHVCPFLADINNDKETLCECCEACQQECADVT